MSKYSSTSCKFHQKNVFYINALPCIHAVFNNLVKMYIIFLVYFSFFFNIRLELKPKFFYKLKIHLAPKTAASHYVTLQLTN